MRGRIIAMIDGVEVRNRFFRNACEHFMHNENFTKTLPAAEVITVPVKLPEGVSPQEYYRKHEKQSIYEWFGSITVGIADKMARKRFGINEALNLSYDQVKTMWTEMGKPKNFKIHRAIQFINQASY